MPIGTGRDWAQASSSVRAALNTTKYTGGEGSLRATYNICCDRRAWLHCDITAHILYIITAYPAPLIYELPFTTVRSRQRTHHITHALTPHNHRRIHHSTHRTHTTQSSPHSPHHPPHSHTTQPPHSSHSRHLLSLLVACWVPILVHPGHAQYCRSPDGACDRSTRARQSGG
jgi:hypothetical protein